MRTKSLRLSQAEIAWLSRYGQAFSSQIREDLALLKEAIRHGESALAEKFTAAEACLLCDVLNGHLFTPQFFTSLPQMLAAEIEDGCRLDGLAEKWDTDGPSLVAKCASLTPWEAYTVHHLVRIFWTGPYHDSDIKSAVAKIFRCAAAQ